jgi:hypothetical protein
VKKNENTCRWRVEFIELTYDGGGWSSWTQWYRTKFGAYFSMYRNVYISSWGGTAELYDAHRFHQLVRKVVH